MKTITLFNFKSIYLVLIVDLILTIITYSMVSKRTDYERVFDKTTVVDFKVIKIDSISSKGVVLKNLKTGREIRRTESAVISIAEGRDTISLQVNLPDALTLEEKDKLWTEKVPTRGTWFFLIVYALVVSYFIFLIDEENNFPFAFFRGIILILIGIGFAIFV